MIVYGKEAIQRLPKEVLKLGNKAFVVLGKDPSRHASLLNLLEDSGIKLAIGQVKQEPEVQDILSLTEAIKLFNPDVVIGLGGGSVIDASKAGAALTTNPGNLFDYLEIIGKGEKLIEKPKPLFAIPTTAGTGSEATKNAVIKSAEKKRKVSLRDDSLLPRIVFIDPSLTLSLPRKVTASSGADALTQLIESYLSIYASPMTDIYCLAGLNRIKTSLLTAYLEPHNYQAREETALASYFSGIALANAKLGSVHGIAGPMGGLIDAAHGDICGSLLLSALQKNISILQGNPSLNSLALQKYQNLAKLLTSDQTASLNDLIEWVKKLIEKLEIPSLSELNFSKTFITDLSRDSLHSSSMKGNPIQLSEKDVASIIENAL